MHLYHPGVALSHVQACWCQVLSLLSNQKLREKRQKVREELDFCSQINSHNLLSLKTAENKIYCLWSRLQVLLLHRLPGNSNDWLFKGSWLFLVLQHFMYFEVSAPQNECFNFSHIEWLEVSETQPFWIHLSWALAFHVFSYISYLAGCLLNYAL